MNELPFGVDDDFFFDVLVTALLQYVFYFVEIIGVGMQIDVGPASHFSTERAANQKRIVCIEYVHNRLGNRPHFQQATSEFIRSDLLESQLTDQFFDAPIGWPARESVQLPALAA